MDQLTKKKKKKNLPSTEFCRFRGQDPSICLSNKIRGKTSPNECPRCDTKQSDVEASVMLELLGIQSTPLLPLLSGRLWLGVAAPDRVL